MQGTDPVGRRRVELLVRSLLPDGYHRQQQDRLDRVDALVADGTFDARSVEVWGDQVPATRAAVRSARGEGIVARVAAFREWAAKNGVSLAPAFAVREVDDSISGEQYRAMRVPAVTLAEFADGRLVCVTPHAGDGGVTTVADRLAALDAGTGTEFSPLERTETGGPDRGGSVPDPVASEDGPIPSE
ncbi:HTH domain-containing protein [Haloarcula litorea]|uniref:HTH domain-containing protein n=1 Tax=Haloarcula litorea TaxID=3032579 RepID=UPI0023E7FD75|nr:HTH domain-containing protein [Halomicroarcula sp. GDY20]